MRNKALHIAIVAALVSIPLAATSAQARRPPARGTTYDVSVELSAKTGASKTSRIDIELAVVAKTWSTVTFRGGDAAYAVELRLVEHRAGSVEVQVRVNRGGGSPLNLKTRAVVPLDQRQVLGKVSGGGGADLEVAATVRRSP